MKQTSILILLFFAGAAATAQDYLYDFSEESPYGKLNPEAPKELLDFGQFVGVYNCTSSTRKANQEWNEPEEIIWRWKYIMNGLAIQDETLKPDGAHSGNIRVYDTDSLTWRVHYYSNKKPTPSLSTWTGGLTENSNIVLLKEQPAPNGTEGYFRITFSDVRPEGYEWLGEWTDLFQNFTFPTWKISCLREK